MNWLLREYTGDFVKVYLDDIVVHTKGTFEEHIQQLRLVLEKLRQANLKIKLKKCHFCFLSIEYLRHIIGRDGVQVDPKKIEKVKNFPRPLNISQLRSFLGLASYYRRFIINFSKIARPLNDLLKKDFKFSWGMNMKKLSNF